MDPDDTQAFKTPPEVETPIAYQVADRKTFGLAPNELAALLAAGTLIAALVLLAVGSLAAGLLLLAAAAFLAALYVEQARRRRAPTVERLAATALDRSRGLAGFAGASMRAWTAAGREAARLRLEAGRLARERSQVQYALGGAAHREDDRETAELRAMLIELDRRIEECTNRAHAAVDDARRRTSDERLAVSTTQIRKPS